MNPTLDRNQRIKATVNLEGLHRLCGMHRRHVLKAKRIGCFFCCEISKPSEIKEWIDGRKIQDWSKAPKRKDGKGLTLAQIKRIPTRVEGQTALCPKCGIDSVIPSSVYGFAVTKPLLKAMCWRWFHRTR